MIAARWVGYLVAALWAASFFQLAQAQNSPGWTVSISGTAHCIGGETAAAEAYLSTLPGGQAQFELTNEWRATVQGNGTLWIEKKSKNCGGCSWEMVAVLQVCNTATDPDTEDTCQQQAGNFAWGTSGAIRSHMDPTEARCDGQCTIRAYVPPEPDIQYHTGGAYGSELWISYLGEWKYDGSQCSTAIDPTPSENQQPAHSCPSGSTMALVGGTDMGCVPVINVTGVGDGNGGLSGTEGTGLTNNPTDNYDPRSCTGGAVAMRDPLGGGTLCVSISSWSQVGDTVVNTVTVAGQDQADDALKRDIGGGDGPGGGGDGGDSCGLPDTPPCKMDEDGTPTAADGLAALQGAIDGIGTAADGHIAAIEGMAGGGGQRTDLGLSWLPVAPVGTCSELSMTVKGYTYQSSWCGTLGLARDVTGWAVLFLAALYVWRRATGTLAPSNA